MALTQKIASAIATGTLLFSSFVIPAFADSTLTVSGNGSDSVNNVSVSAPQTNTVVQDNNAQITNNVNSTAQTGGNTAINNTGGSTNIGTGNASSTVNISNTANVNQAAPIPATGTGTTGVTISGNGASSNNNVQWNSSSNSQTFQENNANLNNNIYSNSSTGNNTAGGNTGGNSNVLSGSAATTTTVTNAANQNMALSAAGTGLKTGTVNALIGGNGASSFNNIGLTTQQSATVVQNNDAYITNNVYSTAMSGNNIADNNTGGSVTVGTGNASSNTTVNNTANFNVASLDSFMTNLSANISGNGFDSLNNIQANLGSSSQIFQGGNEGSGNLAVIDNNLDDPFALTGENMAGGNTGGNSNILSGSAATNSVIHNQVNANIAGSTTGITLLGGGILGFTFNLGNLFNLFGAV
jgi:hypothetical protein